MRKPKLLDQVVRAKTDKRAPVVFTHREALSVLALLNGVYWLIGKILYGSGLRIIECLRLRVKDLDFERLQITARGTKGHVDRFTMLPKSVLPALRQHLAIVKELHDAAMREDYGGVELPTALAKKYPNATYAWEWQYVFPADKPSTDPRSRVRRRHHLYPTTFSRMLKRAVRRAGER